jgi:DNA-directed RNA polymerase III subunit RPC8
MIVFRPFKGEIIAAVVKASGRKGIQLSTQFFQDIFVPSTMLFDSSQ